MQFLNFTQIFWLLENNLDVWLVKKRVSKMCREGGCCQFLFASKIESGSKENLSIHFNLFFFVSMNVFIKIENLFVS